MTVGALSDNAPVAMELPCRSNVERQNIHRKRTKTEVTKPVLCCSPQTRIPLSVSSDSGSGHLALYTPCVLPSVEELCVGIHANGNDTLS